jgi:hypothetical protein
MFNHVQFTWLDIKTNGLFAGFWLFEKSEQVKEPNDISTLSISSGVDPKRGKMGNDYY